MTEKPSISRHIINICLWWISLWGGGKYKTNVTIKTQFFSLYCSLPLIPDLCSLFHCNKIPPKFFDCMVLAVSILVPSCAFVYHYSNGLQCSASSTPECLQPNHCLLCQSTSIPALNSWGCFLTDFQFLEPAWQGLIPNPDWFQRHWMWLCALYTSLFPMRSLAYLQHPFFLCCWRSFLI